MRNIRKIFILGGAGLFGSELIKYALEEGYQIRALDLIRPDDIGDDENLDYIIEDFFKLSDREAIDLLEDCDSFVYAGGVDDLTVPRAPASRFFYEKNTLATGRVARLARKAGVKNFLLLSDYRLDFAENSPLLRKENYHHEPYIETRLMQELVAFYEGDGLMNVSSLRPGVIVGITKRSALGVHLNLVKNLKDVPVTGGSFPLISARSLAKAAILALELEGHRRTYKLATSHMTYKELYELIARALGTSKNFIDKSFDDLYEAYREDEKLARKKGLDHGIGQVNMLRTMCMDMSMDSDFDLEKEDLSEEIMKMVAYIEN